MPIKLILGKKINTSEIDLQGKNDYHFGQNLETPTIVYS